MMLAGAEIVDKDSVTFSSEASSVALPAKEPVAVPAPAPAPVQGLARVPTREAVDICFSNVTCTVNLGINKGIYVYDLKNTFFFLRIGFKFIKSW